MRQCGTTFGQRADRPALIVTDGNNNVEVNNMIDASLLFNVTDPAATPSPTASSRTWCRGFFVVNHVMQPANKVIDVTAQKLAQFIASFQGGSAPGIDQIAVRANDGTSGTPGTRSQSRPIPARGHGLVAECRRTTRGSAGR
jgi:hypothetical protein